MHDIDRTQAETWETYEFGPAEFGYETGEGMFGEAEGPYAGEYQGEYTGETWGEAEGPYAGEYQGEYTGETWGEAEGPYAGEYGYEYAGEAPLGESMELELAAELLEINSEAELDQFLGKLIRSVSRGVGKVMRGPLGSALGGILKGVAKQALPMVGGALGTFVAPGVGTALGSSLGAAAGKAFGLELEGLSAEDQEFELARNYVRFASAAAQEAALAPPSAPPQAVAQQAVMSAAQQHAPGLLSATPPAGMAPRPNGAGGALGQPGYGPLRPGRRPMSGRWVRRGRHVMLFGVYR